MAKPWITMDYSIKLLNCESLRSRRLAASVIKVHRFGISDSAMYGIDDAWPNLSVQVKEVIKTLVDSATIGKQPDGSSHLKHVLHIPYYWHCYASDR